MRLVTIPDYRREIWASRGQYRRDLERAGHIASDRAARGAQQAIRARMRAMKLGRLGNAVGQTSSLRKGPQPGRAPYGVIYAKGGDESRAGGALEAYSRGATIQPKDGNRWLWYQTSAIPRRIGGKRTTPGLFIKSGLVGSIGKLEFRQVAPDLALYVIKRVSLHPKTGRAKALGKRAPRTRIPQAEVVAFVGIRITTRAQRFDKDREAFPFAQRQPVYLAQAMREIEQLRGQQQRR